MGQKALANRFGHRTINLIQKMKQSQSRLFEEWSRKQDPDGLTWRYEPKSKLFYPLDPRESPAPDVNKSVDAIVDS